MTLELWVTRVDMALADLQLNDGFYREGPDTVLPGQVAWERRTATSPYVHYEYLVHATKVLEAGELHVEVIGDTAVDIENRLTDLTAAFQQFSYDLHRRIDGAGGSYRAWRCQPADYAVGGRYRRYRSQAVDVRFTVPMRPIAVV